MSAMRRRRRRLGLELTPLESVRQPEERERRFGDGAKLMLALLRGRGIHRPAVTRMAASASELSLLRDLRDVRQRDRAALRDDVDAALALMQEAIIPPGLSLQDQLLLVIGTQQLGPNTLLALILFEELEDYNDDEDADDDLIRAELVNSRLLARADEAFEPYRDAILDAVLHWSRSRPRVTAVGPQRRQPVRSTRTGPCVMTHRRASLIRAATPGVRDRLGYAVRPRRRLRSLAARRPRSSAATTCESSFINARLLGMKGSLGIRGFGLQAAPGLLYSRIRPRSHTVQVMRR